MLHATRVDEEGDQAAQPTPSNRQVTGGAPSFPLTRDGGFWRTRRPPWHALRLSRGGGGERAWPFAHAHASPPRGHCEGHVPSSRRDCPPAALPPRPRLTGACGTWPPGEPRTVPWGEGRPCGQEGPPGTVPSRDCVAPALVPPARGARGADVAPSRTPASMGLAPGRWDKSHKLTRTRRRPCMRVTKPHKRHAFPWPVRHRTEPPDQTPRPCAAVRPQAQVPAGR